MPKLLLHTSGVPRLAIWMQAILSIAIVWIASLEKLIGYLGMTLSACSALAVSAIFFMPKGSRPLTVLEGSAMVAYVIGTLLMLTSVLVEGQRRVELWAMLITFAIGVLIYIGWQVVSNPDDRDKSKAANGSSTVENHEDTDS